jgi:ABC-2 type transport system ATP-binding protein
MRCVLGLIRINGGEVRLFGNSSPPNAQTLRRIGVAIDTPAFYPWLSGGGFLSILLNAAGDSEGEKACAALTRVGLESSANQRIKTYSQGMRKRLALATAILRDPDLLILDEPTNGMDPSGVHLVDELVTEAKARGAGVLLSSHQLDAIERQCDHVVVLREGRVVASGPPHQIGAHDETPAPFRDRLRRLTEAGGS